MALGQKMAWPPYNPNPHLQRKLGTPNTEGPQRTLKIFHPPAIGYKKKIAHVIDTMQIVNAIISQAV